MKCCHGDRINVEKTYVQVRQVVAQFFGGYVSARFCMRVEVMGVAEVLLAKDLLTRLNISQTSGTPDEARD